MIAMAVDPREFDRFAAQSARAAAILGDELDTAGRQAGFDVAGRAQQLAPRDTGAMANLIGPPEVHRIGAAGVEVIVAASARSRDGFPYPVAVEYGRAAIDVGPGRVMRFEIDGRVIYTRRVRATRPQPFMRPALDQRADAIVAYFAIALGRAADRMVA